MPSQQQKAKIRLDGVVNKYLLIWKDFRVCKIRTYSKEVVVPAALGRSGLTWVEANCFRSKNFWRYQKTVSAWKKDSGQSGTCFRV